MRALLTIALLMLPLASAANETGEGAPDAEQSLEERPGISWGIVALIIGAALVATLAWSLRRQDRGE